MRYVLLTAAVVLVSACGGSDFVPGTPSGPTIPSVGGTYGSSSMYRFERSSAARQNDFNCSGSLTIGRQVGNTFTGTFLIRDDLCGTASGTVTNGSLGADGTISFELTSALGSDPNFLTGAFLCTYVSGDRALTGTLIGGQLTAEAQTVMDCGPTEGIVTQHLRLTGAR